MLDVECSIRGTAESYVAKVKVQHKQNPRLFEPRTVDCRSFGIQHFAGRVTYDASDFLGMWTIIFFNVHVCSYTYPYALFKSTMFLHIFFVGSSFYSVYQVLSFI